MPTWASNAWAAFPRASTRPTVRSQLAYILNDSDTQFLIVENDEQLDKFLEIPDGAPGRREGHHP